MKKLLICLLLVAGFQSVSQAVGPFTQQPWGQSRWAGSTADMGRGGAGIAYLDSTRLHEQNPATFHMGRLTRFQIGFSGAQSSVSDGDVSETLSAGAFDSWALGFPLLWKNLSAGLLLRPMSSVDYLHASSTADDLGREYTVSRKGSGGLSEVAMVLAGDTKVKGLRLGLQLGVQFGSILEEWKLFYPESAPPYDSWVNQRRSLIGFQPRLGVHYTASRLMLGLSWAPASSADLTIDLENKANSTDGEVATTSTKLPGELAAGLALRLDEWWLCADLHLQDWSSTDMGLEGNNQLRVDQPLGLALGLELPMSEEFAAPFFRRADWRFGMRMEQSYADWLRSEGVAEKLESLTFSGGLSLPLKSRGTWLDLAVEYELRGDTGTLGLDEKTLRVRAGFSARDIWFLRPKY